MICYETIKLGSNQIIRKVKLKGSAYTNTSATKYGDESVFYLFKETRVEQKKYWNRCSA